MGENGERWKEKEWGKTNIRRRDIEAIFLGVKGKIGKICTNDD